MVESACIEISGSARIVAVAVVVVLGNVSETISESAAVDVSCAAAAVIVVDVVVDVVVVDVVVDVVDVDVVDVDDVLLPEITLR